MGGSSNKHAKLFQELVDECLRLGSPSPTILLELWNKADKSKSGFLNHSGATQFFGSLYDWLKKNKKDKINDVKKNDCVQRWIREFDQNGDGKLSKEEFFTSLINILDLQGEEEEEDIKREDEIKVILIGALPCEIKRHVVSFLKNKYCDPVETEFQDYERKLSSGETHTLSITIGPVNTIDEDEHARFRPVTYVFVDYVMIVFSVVIRWTFEIIDLLQDEIETNIPGTPFVLVGVHTELRGEGSEVVTKEEAETKAKTMGALKYYEVSAAKMEGLKECFDGSLEVWRNQKK